MKRPAFQFYPGDWLRDTALRACSIEARGLWIDLLALMHQAEPYGHLVLNGTPITDATLARMVGEPVSKVRKALAELEANGVSSRTDSGYLYSRRMVKDERLRNVRADCGKLGGNPKLLNQVDNQTVNQPPKQSPTPSSSSSSSSSKDQKKRASAPPPCPADWIKPEVWADFVAHRKSKRAPLTERAMALIVTDLEAYRSAGVAPETVLEFAIKNGHTGLFYKPETRAAVPTALVPRARHKCVKCESPCDGIDWKGNKYCGGCYGNISSESRGVDLQKLLAQRSAA